MNFCYDQQFPDIRDQAEERHRPSRITYCVRRFRSCDNETCREGFAIQEAWEDGPFPRPRFRNGFPSAQEECSLIPVLDRDLPQSESQELACTPGGSSDRVQVDTRSGSIRFEGPDPEG